MLYKQAELIDVFEDYITIGSDIFTEYKNSALQEMCKSLGVSYTGKKSVLVKRIIEALGHEFPDMLNKESGNQNFLGETACNYFAVHDLGVKLAKYAVRCIERGKKTIDENGIVKYEENDSYEACAQIANTNYTEEIFRDIAQEVRADCIEALKMGRAYIFEGRIRFCDSDFNREGMNTVFKALHRCLSSYRRTHEKGMKEGRYVVGYDKDGREIEVHETDKSYIRVLASSVSIDDIEHGADIVNFFRFMRDKVKNDRKCKQCVLIFKMLICGDKPREIEKALDITERTFERRVELIHAMYRQYESFTCGYDTCSDTYGGYMLNTYGYTACATFAGFIGIKSELTGMYEGRKFNPAIHSKEGLINNRQKRA